MHINWRVPAALFLLFATGVPAFANVINITAVSFVLRTANASGDLVGEASNGELLNATGKYYAPVILQMEGRNICRFSLVYRDNDTDFDVTAKLLKKTYVVGGSASTPPVVLATRKSVGAVDAVRKATTTTIFEPTVVTARAFYFVELTVPFQGLEILGVEIEVLPTCT